jgi:hypothetical protein
MSLEVFMQKILVLLVAGSALILADCSDGSAGKTGGTSDAGATNESSNFLLFVGAYPAANNQTVGPTTYVGYAQIEDTRLSDYGNPAGAVVMINGVQLLQRPDVNNYYFSSPNVGSFSEGDEVSMSVEYDKIGTISTTMKVPTSVVDFALLPPLPATGVPNSATSYYLSWSPSPDADFYLPGYVVYSDSRPTLVTGQGTFVANPNTAFTFTSADLTSASGTPYPFLDIYLSTCAEFRPADVAPVSSFELRGVDTVLKRNY